MNLRLKQYAVTAVVCIAIACMTCITSFAASATYTYDDLNRLRSIEYGDGTVIQYSYDEVGNRVIQEPSATTLPVSNITAPADGATLDGVNVLITGMATGWDSGLQKVEVSANGGTPWRLPID